MNNHCKLIIFPILIFHILFGCAESTDYSGTSTKSSIGDNSSQNDNSDQNDNSNQSSSNKLESISQNIISYINNTAKITLSSKSNGSGGITYKITQYPKHGTLYGSAPYYKYRPKSGFIGLDQFLFRVSQNSKESDSAVIKINVVPYDHAPSVKAKASGVNSIIIYWGAIQGATSYKIYRENSTGGTFQTVLEDEIVGTSFTDSGLAPTTEYHYQVTAMWHWQESKKSKTVSALTSQPLFEPVSYNFDGGLPKHWSADNTWKTKSPRNGESSIGFENKGSGSTSMTTHSFQVPSYGANLSFWHRFTKPINYKIEWSSDNGKYSWRSLHQKSFKSKKIVKDTLHRPVSYYYSNYTSYRSYTETKNYNVPEGASNITIKVSGGEGCTYGYKKIYVNGYRYNFGTISFPLSRLWGSKGQLKIYIYENCYRGAKGYNLEIHFSGSEMADENQFSDWEKISIPLDAVKGRTVWFQFTATDNNKYSKWNIDDLKITPNPVPAPKLKISTIDKHTLKLSWNNVSEGMVYDLFRSESEEGNYELIESAINETSFTDINLKAHTKYFYTVHAVYQKIKSPLSSVVSAFTIPPPTSGSVATPLSSDSVLVFWNLVKGVENYELYRSTSSDSGFELINSNQKSLGFNDTTVKCETTYYYRIKSVSNGKRSEFSDFSRVLTPSVLPSKPNVPLAMLINKGTEIKLSWRAVECAKSYNIYRSKNGTQYVMISNSTDLEYTDFNLEEGMGYSYKVSGVSTIGEGPMSANSNSLLTPPLPPDSLVLNVISSRQIDLKWNKVNTATLYTIYISNTRTGTYQKTGSTSSLNFSSTRMSPDTVYYFKVIATNSGGESKHSETISARTLPPPPKGITVKTFNNIASIINWNLLKDATNYNIYRAQSYSGPYEIIEQNWESTIYIDTNLEKGSVYYYKISSVFRNSIEGEISDWATASK